jgi:hypothetical protein
MALAKLNLARQQRENTAQSNVKKLEARVGVEPTNGGFADLSLRPLGYRAKPLSISNL